MTLSNLGWLEAAFLQLFPTMDKLKLELLRDNTIGVEWVTVTVRARAEDLSAHHLRARLSGDRIPVPGAAFVWVVDWVLNPLPTRPRSGVRAFAVCGLLDAEPGMLGRSLASVCVQHSDPSLDAVRREDG